jgi:excisionase family DNA binding protein
MERILLKPIEAAEVLGLSRSSVYELIRSGELPTVLVGGIRRVPMAELKRMVAAKVKGEEAGDVA